MVGKFVAKYKLRSFFSVLMLGFSCWQSFEQPTWLHGVFVAVWAVDLRDTILNLK